MSPDPGWMAVIDWFGLYILLPLMLLFIMLGLITVMVVGAASVVESLKKKTKK